MRLIIPDVKNYSTATTGEAIEDETGITVGQLIYSKGEGRSVSLFGGNRCRYSDLGYSLSNCVS